MEPITKWVKAISKLLLRQTTAKKAYASYKLT